MGQDRMGQAAWELYINEAKKNKTKRYNNQLLVGLQTLHSKGMQRQVWLPKSFCSHIKKVKGNSHNTVDSHSVNNTKFMKQTAAWAVQATVRTDDAHHDADIDRPLLK